MRPLSRYTVSLQTDHTRPESYYHQICALSEQTINKNFEKIFEQRKEDLPVLKYWKGNIDDGQLMAILKSPVVSLQLQNVENPQMLFRLRFKSGYVKVGKGAHNHIDLAGWEIAVPAYLNKMVVNPPADKELSQDVMRLANDSFAELKKSYEFRSTATPEEQRPSTDKPPPPRMMKPGEYSIHRLFAAINDTDWGLPDMEESCVPDGHGTTISLKKWTEDAENLDRQASVMHVIRSWATSHRHSSLFTLGLQVELPEKEDSRTPSFIPTALRLQNYPYFSDEEIQKYQSPENFPVGEVGRPYNCFVYCEATNGKDLPSVKRLPFTGNLAEPNGPLGGDLGTGEVNGSFVVDHHLYLEGRLLPLLRDLCRAIQVIPLAPEYSLWEDKKDKFLPRFAFGRDPDDALDKSRLPNPQVNRGDASDKHFNWKPSPGGGYEWSDFVEAWGSKTECYDFGAIGYQPGPFFRRWNINASMKINISWDAGTSKIKVSGNTTYFHWEGYNRSTRDFTASPGGGCLWGEFETVATWSIMVNLTVPKTLQNDPNQVNGIIEPVIEGINPKTSLPNDWFLDKSRMKHVLGDAHVRIGNGIGEQISASLSNINQIIKGKFAALGNFFYPGTRELDFGPPCLTKGGDIIARISYKDPPAGRVTVRPPGKTKWEVPAPKDPDTVVGDPILDPEVFPRVLPLLTWTGSVDSYEPSSQLGVASKALVVFRASNKTGKKIAFHRIKLDMMMTQKLGLPETRLFTEDNPDVWKQWVDPQIIIKEWEARKKARLELSKKAAEAAKKAREEAEEAAAARKQAEKEKKKTGKELENGKPLPGSKTSVAVPPGIASPQKEDLNNPPEMVPTKEKVDTMLNPADDPDSEPEPPLPKATFLLSQQEVARKGKLRVRWEGTGIVFEVMPLGSNGTVDDSGKFIMGRDATLEIVLEGDVSISGKYLLKIEEFWADPTDEDSNVFEEFTEAYVEVELNPSGNGTVKALDYEEMKRIQELGK